ncbi:Uncharacterized protein HZ326_10289 [Fusarium oxysporum f. sp. albedinis]|nr:Uncharacterized protein HZ326_10289 [Fusarium oxysporum f. sp. albedinis]
MSSKPFVLSIYFSIEALNVRNRRVTRARLFPTTTLTPPSRNHNVGIVRYEGPYGGDSTVSLRDFSSKSSISTIMSSKPTHC